MKPLKTKEYKKLMKKSKIQSNQKTKKITIISNEKKKIKKTTKKINKNPAPK